MLHELSSACLLAENDTVSVLHNLIVCILGCREAPVGILERVKGIDIVGIPGLFAVGPRMGPILIPR